MTVAEQAPGRRVDSELKLRSDSSTTETRILENKMPISPIAGESYERHCSHVI